MAFKDYAESGFLGKPAFLLHFKHGPGLSYRYTTAVQDVVFEGEVFEATPISFANIESKGAPDDDKFEIEVPRTLPLCDLFTAYPPTTPVSLVIRQGHLGNEEDPESFSEGENWPVLWRGTVTESSRDGPTTTLQAQSLNAALERPGLQSHYQWSCPLALYGARCGANRERATFEASVVSVNGTTLSLPQGFHGTHDPKSFLGGVVEWNSDLGLEHRSILRVAEKVVTEQREVAGSDPVEYEDVDVVVFALSLSGVIRGLAQGDTVNAVLGCGHNMRDCRNVHENIKNYGGFPWIPNTNPFNKNNHY